MIKERIPAIGKLTKDEKLILASEVFKEEDIELTDEQKKELNKRIEYAKQHPEEMISWAQVKDDLKKKYGD